MTKKLKTTLEFFSVEELVLWLVSILLVVSSFLMLNSANWLSLVASLVGVTSLIFNAKGHPVGQILMVVFSILYGIISYSFAYYGEMITYLGMTAPMAVFSFVSWVRNPYAKDKAEVEVNCLKIKEYIFMVFLAVVVTGIFYKILTIFHTANIVPSTISVTTSFVAAYLTFRRSPFFALAYATNDLVLIVLWILASFSDISFMSVVICFVVFFINDIYGFINWKRIQKKQNVGKITVENVE